MGIRGKARVFISYRREGGVHLASRVAESLRERGLDVFMDFEDLRAGPFNTALLGEIEARSHLLVILTPGSLDRCAREDDWLRLEVAHALAHDKTVVPVMDKGFTWPGELPEDLKALPLCHGLAPSHDLFDASMSKLVRLVNDEPEPRPRRRSPGLLAGALVGMACIIAALAIVLWGRWGGGPAPTPTGPPAGPHAEVAPPEPLPPEVAGTAFGGAGEEQPPRPPERLALDLGGNVSMELVLIRPGTFLMGSPADEQGRNDNEGPQREVTITRPIFMAIAEVTQEQYEQVMGDNPSHFAGGTNPVEMVSWADARQFCEKLSARTGKSVRLPTEAEWEYACRAGTRTRFCSGDDEAEIGDCAWHSGNSDGRTHPVGQKTPNSFGLCDMHGNVREWCADYYDESHYASAKNLDPVGPASGPLRVLRGGSWLNAPALCRSAARLWSSPGLCYRDAGFRVAVDVD